MGITSHPCPAQVALERFLNLTTSRRGQSVVEQDRSSVFYYLLAAPDRNRARLVDVLDAFEASAGRPAEHRSTEDLEQVHPDVGTIDAHNEGRKNLEKAMWETETGAMKKTYEQVALCADPTTKKKKPRVKPRPSMIHGITHGNSLEVEAAMLEAFGDEEDAVYARYARDAADPGPDALQRASCFGACYSGDDFAGHPDAPEDFHAVFDAKADDEPDADVAPPPPADV